MPLTIQTIDRMQAILAKKEGISAEEVNEYHWYLRNNIESFLSAARWALEAGYGQGSDDEIIESPDMRAAKVFKNGFEVTYAKEGESVAIDQPNSSSQDGRKG